MQEQFNIFDEPSQNELVKAFENADFGVLRTIKQDNGEVWFVAVDVCRILDIKNPSDAIKALDEDERARFNLGRQGEANCITEAGLYTFALRSRKEEARPFRRWVTHEVLPSIRKTGDYQTPMDDMELLSRAVLISDKKIKELQSSVQQKQERIDLLEPKAEFAEAIGDSKSLILIRDLAHLLKQNGVDIGGTRLFTWLRENGYLEKHRNEPTQRALKLGVIRVVEGKREGKNGAVFITRTPKVTGKGQRYFIEKLCGQKAMVM